VMAWGIGGRILQTPKAKRSSAGLMCWQDLLPTKHRSKTISEAKGVTGPGFIPETFGPAPTRRPRLNEGQ